MKRIGGPRANPPMPHFGDVPVACVMAEKSSGVMRHEAERLVKQIGAAGVYPGQRDKRPVGKGRHVCQPLRQRCPARVGIDDQHLRRARAHRLPQVPKRKIVTLGFSENMAGVGRPAVREALQHPHRMGFITISHREHTSVEELRAGSVLSRVDEAAQMLFRSEPGPLNHLKEARRMFECGMIRPCIAQITGRPDPDRHRPVDAALAVVEGLRPSATSKAKDVTSVALHELFSGREALFWNATFCAQQWVGPCKD